MTNKIEAYREQRQIIIDDLRVCIGYTPDRDNGLLSFMEQYLKALGNDIIADPFLL
jgi:hypothetical protein